MLNRKFGTDKTGRNFIDDVKLKVWNKAQRHPGKYGDESRYWRMDACGASIYWYDYGDTSSLYGWEIDHILAVALGGGDELSNLQALQWQNNRAKGDAPPTAPYCVIGV